MPKKSAMDRLAASAKRLNTASDELNAVIEAFEDHLQRSGVGLTFWYSEDWKEHTLLGSKVTRDVNDETETQTGFLLGFAKLDGRWSLAVKPVSAVTIRHETKLYDEGAPVPLTKAARAIRMEAALLFADFAEGLIRRMDEYSLAVESAKRMNEDEFE